MGAIKPLKGCKREELIDGVPLPCGLSFKVDGIRGMAYDGAINSTSGAPLRNLQIQAYIKSIPEEMWSGLDFEVIAGNPWDKNVMQAATTAAMNTNAETDFSFWVFDDFSNKKLPFKQRYANYCQRVDDLNKWCYAKGLGIHFNKIEYRHIETMEQYNAMKEEAAQKGFEGLYGKSWDGEYKEGRATPKQRWVWKDKPWTDEEGLVVDALEMMENTNEAEEDNFGRTKRSKASEGLVGKGYLGSFVVINDKYKDDQGRHIPFRVSAGTLTMEERKKLWELWISDKDDFFKKMLTYKFFDFGIVDVPRSALFKSWRDPIDTDTEE